MRRYPRTVLEIKASTPFSAPGKEAKSAIPIEKTRRNPTYIRRMIKIEIPKLLEQAWKETRLLPEAQHRHKPFRYFWVSLDAVRLERCVVGSRLGLCAVDLWQRGPNA